MVCNVCLFACLQYLIKQIKQLKPRLRGILRPRPFSSRFNSSFLSQQPTLPRGFHWSNTGHRPKLPGANYSALLTRAVDDHTGHSRDPGVTPSDPRHSRNKGGQRLQDEEPPCFDPDKHVATARNAHLIYPRTSRVQIVPSSPASVTPCHSEYRGR